MTLEAPTPSVFYWKVLGVVQGLVLGWVLGGEGVSEKKTKSIDLRFYQSVPHLCQRRG